MIEALLDVDALRHDEQVAGGVDVQIADDDHVREVVDACLLYTSDAADE